MLEKPLLFSIIWICVMLIYLLGDVLRIISGDMGKYDMSKFTKPMFLFISILMVLPILMVFLSVALPLDYSKNLNILMAVFFFLFNLVGLPSYKSAYDKFLLLVSMVFNGLTIYYAYV